MQATRGLHHQILRRNANMAEQSTNTDARAAEDAGEYWSANIRIILISLVIWALVSFGFGIVLRPMLSGIEVGGTDLGFWFAQQGSILVFLGLIFFYAWRMNKLDKEYGVEE
jgi:putative solute:sodium symporter small subunit